MNGALTLHRSVLWVGRHAKTAMIASYDLDGTPLESHFHFRDEEAGRSSVAGLAVDADHRVWVAVQLPTRGSVVYQPFSQKVLFLFLLF